MRPLLTWVPTKDSAVEIGYKIAFGQSPEFWIFLDGDCVGYIMFSYALTSQKLFRWFPKGTKFAQPHCSITGDLKGLGYPSTIYDMAMSGGMVLYTYEHTAAAASLWESLVRKTKAKLYHYDFKTDSFLTEATSDSMKVLTHLIPTKR